MADRFPLTRIPEPVRDIAARLRAAGYEAWYVGGAIRDALLADAGRPMARTGDYDIATSARPDEVQALFRRTVPIGVEHGTVAVLDQEGGAHEVTTFRRDVRTDGRHAEVEFGVSVDEDLARRDLTINAIAVHPETGELRDPFGGRADLAAGLVRAVGDAATRFREDRLRVLRALRFSAVLGFAVEPATWAALVAAAGDLDHLSRERVRDEWVKSLQGAGADPVLGLWSRAGVLARVWPEMGGEQGAGETGGQADRRTGGQSPVSSPQSPVPNPQDAVLQTAIALHRAGVTGAAAKQACLRLRFANREVARVEAAMAAMANPIPTAADGPALRRWVARHRGAWEDGVAAIADPGTAAAARERVEAVLASGAPLALGELAVRGEDLQSAGVAAGPAMGRILRQLLEETLDDPALNERERLLARARELA